MSKKTYQLSASQKAFLNSTSISSSKCLSLESAVKKLMELKKAYLEAKQKISSNNNVAEARRIVTKIAGNKYLSLNKDAWINSVIKDIDDCVVRDIVRKFKVSNEYLRNNTIEIKKKVLVLILAYVKKAKITKTKYTKQLRLYVKFAFEAKEQYSELDFLEIPFY